MKRFALLISTIVLCFLFLKLLINYSDGFSGLSENRFSGLSEKDSISVDLASCTEHAKIVKALKNVNAIDEHDAEFIATQIEQKGKKIPLNSLSDFNKRVWQISYAVINSDGSNGFKNRLEKSKRQLGQDEEYRQLKEHHYNKFEKTGDGKILVKIYEKEEDKGLVSKIFSKSVKPCGGITVRLSEHYIDSLNTAERKTLAWAKTDSLGIVEFSGLDVNKSYSVLPIASGFEYGSPKGTTKGSLAESSKNGSAIYSFVQQEHKIRMFDAKALAQIKEQHILTVRSFEKYKSILTLYLILFFAVWWGLSLLWYFRHKNPDNSIIAALMFLTGLCILVMFSINDPLEDVLFGVDMAQGVIAGVVVMGLIQFVDFTKLYQNRAKIGFDIPSECINWLFKPFRKKILYLTQILSGKRYNILRKCMALLVILLCLPFLLLDLLRITKLSDKVDSMIGKLPKGSGYLITALLLTALLWSPLGSDVGGMKVNLNLFGIKFQPSEIAKYLIIFFMAAFFSFNANKIMKYSDKGNVELLGRKIKMLSAIIVGLGLLMGMYLVLGDMGPALVLAFTFIILYSIVKSKVDLENLDERSQNIKILTCDLAMLAYGVTSFIVFLYIGNVLGNMLIFCLGWFVLWIAFGLYRKQLFESAILFNLIISAFIFGGALLSKTQISSLNKIGERLESRNEMCTNTWGTLPIGTMTADAGENTQVAEGLWGLASGGFWGQGLGNGSPNFIPAFHTDMILETIGEQLGFIGVFVVILLLALLLRKTILSGYKTSHPFAFYLCLGISIVTAVQFVVISLGSTGIIPLTGVTVPFLSYGKVSMILNLAAFGIILSFNTVKARDKAVAPSTSGKNIRQYNYSVSILSWLYCGIALFICLVFFHYQFTDRNATLIKPVYVHNADGVPVVEYNPRITQLTNKMWAGDIYDRKGVLLATSDTSKIAKHNSTYTKINGKIGDKDFKLQFEPPIPQKRYYPFGNYLTFMLGKYGSDIASFRSENSGYAAEYRHMNELRGYDNKKYIVKDGKKIPLKVTLSSKEFKPGHFVEKSSYSVKDLQLRDYSALIPYLKAGNNSKRVAKLNARDESFFAIGKIKPQDIHLTIDAELQTMLQYEIVNHVKKHLSGKNKLRVSVVILDAQNGDLLSSAIYPLPDEDRLREEQTNGTRSYRDINKPGTWKSYSDVDLGLIYPSAPGSTAKVLVGLAGFRKEHDKIAGAKYDVYKEEIIYDNGDKREPYGKNMSMEFAYNKSSNCYFINLLNDKDLFDDLAYVYGESGISIDGEKSYNLIYDKPTNEWLSSVKSPGDKSIESYRKYITNGKKSKFNDRKPDCWLWAYGQGTMDATPLAMARAVSAVVNDGKMPKTQYVLSNGNESISIIDNSSILKSYLKSTAKSHDGFTLTAIGGKTGTPERAIKTETKKLKLRDGSVVVRTSVKDKSNDGWYICFIEDATVATKEQGKDIIKKRNAPLAIAIRMERLGGDGSIRAVNLMKDVVMPTLERLEYIK